MVMVHWVEKVDQMEEHNKREGTMLVEQDSLRERRENQESMD
jgi:hypothetical protein